MNKTVYGAAAVFFGIAIAAASLVLVTAWRAPPKIILSAEETGKGDRLSIPVMDQSKLFGEPTIGHAGRLWFFDVPNSEFDSRDGGQSIKHSEDDHAQIPDQRRVDDDRGIHGAASSDLPARHPRNERSHEQSSAGATDSVCGSRGRTYYRKENGWRYWKCNR